MLAGLASTGLASTGLASTGLASPEAWLRWMSQTLGSQYRPVSWSRSICTVARPAGNT